MSTTLEDERLREVVRLVDELKASEARTAELKARLSALLGAPAPNGASAVSVPTKPTAPAALSDSNDESDEDEEEETEQPADDKTAGSYRSRVFAAFQRQPGKKVMIENVVKELPDIPPNLVRSYASRFTKDGDLKRVKRGVYKYETEE